MKELSEVLQDWEAVIGLEIHTELTALDTKMFCNCKLSHDDEPNANVCPVCLGLPGALPVPNKRAIESIVKAGLATNCEIQRHSMFYRKHYFYPDMAKNFQTTQGPVAFAMYGHLDLDVTGRGAAERPDCAFGEAEAQSLASASANAEGLSTSMTSTMREGNQRAGHLASYDASNLQMPERREDGSYTVPIRILRIHMEEDAGKLNHDPWEDVTLVDYNRGGTPLIEIVTEPDFRSAEEVTAFLEKLRATLKYLGVSDCKMQEGSMRADVNLSVRPAGSTELGTRTEMKNLNSLKAIGRAINYEFRRQCEVIEEGGTVVQQTRRWDENKDASYAMRSKENAHDYRYFPDPDLVPIVISDEWLEEVRESLPEMPEAKKARYMDQFGLTEYDSSIITSSKPIADLFEEAADICKKPKDVANWIMGDLMKLLNDSGTEADDVSFDPAKLAAVVELVDKGTVNRNTAKRVFEEVYRSNVDPEQYVKEQGLGMITDEAAVLSGIEKVLAANEKAVADYKGGNQKTFGFIVGQVMKEFRGKADPALINRLLKEALNR